MKKNAFYSFSTFALLLVCFVSGFGQIELPKHFEENLQEAKLEFYMPLENSFRNLTIRENNIHAYDLAIKSKEENVEIRYVILPVGHSIGDELANIKFVSKASSIASNEAESSTMVFHPMETSEAKNTFNADWGASVFFQPKLQFSHREHCKMVALHAEGKANVYIFYLFDDVSIDLNALPHLIRFADEKMELNDQTPN